MLTVTSDERDKGNVAPFTEGLNFIRGLEPIRFNFDPRGSYPETNWAPDGSKAELTPRIGSSAQPV